MFQEWRWLILVYIVCTGVWSVLAKVATGRVGAATTTFVIVTGAWMVVASAVLRQVTWKLDSGLLAAMLAGLLAGIGSVSFYGALHRAPASVVLPLSSLYLVVTVLLAFVFLGEAIGIRRLAGVACAMAAVALLAR